MVMSSPQDSSDGLPPLREVIRTHGLRARRSLGQNFILDLNLTRRIARAGGPLEGIRVIEVGPGPGGLTRALLMEGAAHVTVIERDRRCLPALAEISARYGDKLTVIHEDALSVDWKEIGQRGDRLVANLPYGLASELLVRWLSDDAWPPWFDCAVLMFQKEVAERIVAPPGNRTYGRLSVLAQWRTQPQLLFTLPPQAFTPAPSVESALVALQPHQALDETCSVVALSRLTAAAFGQRRKMLRSALRQLTDDPIAMLETAGIDPTWRAEQLSVSDFARLASCMSMSPS